VTGEVRTITTNKISIPPRLAALLSGEMDVEDLDDEELARGYPRSADGSFRGGSKIVPRIVYDRMMRELFARADTKLKENLVAAVEVLTNIATNDEVDPAQRLKAVQMILERVRGKTPDVVITTETKKWETVMEGVMRGPRPGSPDEARGMVIDGDDGREP
jgi:hypothetical protein